MRGQRSVAERRNYSILDIQSAKRVARVWLESLRLEKAIDFGLPEIDDRSHVWRVPLLSSGERSAVGEVVIDARSALVLPDRSTSQRLIEARLAGHEQCARGSSATCSNDAYSAATPLDMIALGDAEEVLPRLPANSVDLVFTSPPYYNARPEYTDFVSYDEYLLKLRTIIRGIHRVLCEGRFFVINVSPVLIRRTDRSRASKRIAVPFDVHGIFIQEGYDFVDDIIWQKPEGAGWATGRGRRFAADRNPLQYKPVPVTEYVLVYRKRTDKLIDWNIRAHPDQVQVESSRINGDYERTNIWQIRHAYDKRHPAVFPLELATKVVTYYSFRGDVVLDPFAGLGTTGKAAAACGRRFVLIEKEPKYVEIIQDEMNRMLGTRARDIVKT
ncbi:MAG TPA: site-specific DNA-methyltransferase [Ardenticatenaceae bacterium]|nr:site-specific DNA-methyltransferase [Ardenticatenaceae bacterium]